MKKKLFKTLFCTCILSGIALMTQKEKVLATEAYYSDGIYYDYQDDNGTLYNVIEDGILADNDDAIETKYEIRETNDNDCKITAKVMWVDRNGESHPLRRNEIIFTIGYRLPYFETTDNNGEIEFNPNKSNYRPISLVMSPSNDAAYVTGGEYTYTAGFVETGRNQSIHFDVRIYAGQSEMANAFDISQSVIPSKDYVYRVAKYNMNQVEIVYPDKSEAGKIQRADGSVYYSTRFNPLYGNIRVPSDGYGDTCWLDLGHEYGHYIDMTFRLSALKSDLHADGESLIKQKKDQFQKQWLLLMEKE